MDGANMLVKIVSLKYFVNIVILVLKYITFFFEEAKLTHPN